jgi:hypothetical protein
LKKISIFICLLLFLSSFGIASAETQEMPHVIPYPEGYDTESSGASSYQNIGDHEDSIYFAHPDFYNMESNETLTILKNFRTYQQTTEWSCGPASALMVLYHYGVEDWEELEIAEIMDAHKDLNGNNTEEPGVANERGEWGTSTDRMIQFFDYIEWEVQSSLTEGVLEGGLTFDDPLDFQNWAIENLKNNTPIMIEDCDWGGHWKVLIGYDTMGTEDFGDDVLIFADPYDTSDHLQDGYFIVPAERFFYMWYDDRVLPEDQSDQQWIIAKPKQ